MLFECRAQSAANVPGAIAPSEAFRQVAADFAAGRVRRARRALAVLEAEATPKEAAADWLLAADILRGAGDGARSLRRLAQGRRQFPDDLDLAKAWLFEVGGRRRLDRDLALLERIRATVPERERGGVDALTALTWARAGFGRRAADARDRALAGGLRQSLVVGALTEVELRLHRYDEAVEFAQRAVQQAPRWPRARARLAEALVARCRVEEASRVLWTLLPDNAADADDDDLRVEDAGLELQAGWLFFLAGDHAAALPLLWRYQYSWPAGGRGRLDLGATLERLPWRLEAMPAFFPARAEAQNAAAWTGLAPKLAPSPARRQISAPPIKVDRGSAWAAAIATAACGQGVTIEPRALVDAAPPQGGSPLWRLVEVLVDRHFRIESLRADPEVICSLLDQRVAPLGLVAGWPQGRVEILAGYDRESRLFLVRDPTRLEPALVPWDEVAARYAALGGVLAVMVPLRAFEIALPPGARAVPMHAALEAERAAALGERERLERAYALAAADRGACRLRGDLAGLGIAWGPREFARRLAAQARDPRLPRATRQAAAWQLLTSLLGRPAASPSQGRPEGDGGAPWLEAAEAGEILAAFFEKGTGADERRLGRLLRAVARRDAGTAARRSEALVERWPGLAVYRRLLAQSAAWLGDAERARWCCHQALELAPDDIQSLVLVRRLDPTPAPVLEAIAELRKLAETFPYDPWLKLELVATLADQGDGAAYERALLEVLRLLPRWPSAWWRLVRWYEQQERLDLARAVRDRALLWLSEEELETEPSLDPAWWRRSAVVGQQVGSAIRRQDLVAARLPPALPGPVQACLIAFLDALSPLHLDRVFAGAVQAWVLRLVEGQELWPALDARLGLLEEVQGEMKAANARYRRLHREQPGLALAWRRVAVHLEQRDAAAALEANRRALAGRPAEASCLEALARIEQAFGHPEGELRAREALCKLWPYAFAPTEQLALAILEFKGLSAALGAVEDRRGQLVPGDVAALRARLLAEGEDFESALAELERWPEARKARPLLATLAELRVAEAAGDFRRAAALVEEGRERNPDHPDLLAAYARDLGRRQPGRLPDFLRETLRAGGAPPHFLRDFLATQDEPVAAALALIDEAGPGQRAALAHQAAPLVGELGGDALDFLNEASHRLADDADLLERHTQALIAAGRKDEAVASARRLFEVEPESARAIGLLADCLRDIAPREAHAFLLMEFEKTGSLECLAQIAESYRRLGEDSRAIATWHQVLELENEQPDALVALYTLGERSPELATGLIALVGRGRGFDQPMAHVAAVDLAIVEQRTLPEAWLEGAQRRFDRLKRSEKADNDDERLRLGLALAKWLQHHGRKDDAKAARLAAGSTWRRLRLLDWPAGRRWIPAAELAVDEDTE